MLKKPGVFQNQVKAGISGIGGVGQGGGGYGNLGPGFGPSKANIQQNLPSVAQ